MSSGSDPKRMRELARAGGKASGEARRRKRDRSPVDVLRDVIHRDPERWAQAVVGSAWGAAWAGRLVGLEGAGEPKANGQEASSLHGFPDIVRLAYASGQAALLGLPTTAEELDALLATRDPRARDRRNHAPPRVLQRAEGRSGRAWVRGAAGAGG